MKNIPIFTCLLFLFTNVARSQESAKEAWENYPKTISLAFQDRADGHESGYEIDIVSFVPLKSKSSNVFVTKVMTGDAQSFDGLMLAENRTGTDKVPFYIFNSATQCFEFGYVVTVHGQSYWSAGTASEQVAHNICAPKGEMYCRKKS